MDIQTAKQIKIADFLHSLGYSPVKQQGINLWYKSPLREETEASFKVNTERNQWYDFALGRGGNIIALAQELYCSDYVPYLLQKIEEQTPHIHPVSFSFGKQSFSEPSFQQLDIVLLASPSLLAYLQEKENVRKPVSPTTANGISPLPFRTYRADMKSATDISRDVSHQKKYPISDSQESQGVHVTFLRDLWRLESCPQSPDFDRQDYIVLNSVANVPKALYPLGSYERIHCFFDNDRAGMEAIQQIRKEYDATRYIRDASQIYSGCKDLNEYLQK